MARINRFGLYLQGSIPGVADTLRADTTFLITPNSFLCILLENLIS